MNYVSLVYVTVTTVCITTISVKADSVLLMVTVDLLQRVASLQFTMFMLKCLTIWEFGSISFFIQHKLGYVINIYMPLNTRYALHQIIVAVSVVYMINIFDNARAV